ncbi:hypothetical protein C8J57DRAFT_231280 [Mycena rebaudengoi]|nr:hypothetical protein C8J57DRAFT_231280 [Mycena rebaudengoi]
MDANLPAAAKVHRCGYCQKTFLSRRRRDQHARQLQHWIGRGGPPTRTTQPPTNLYRCGDCQKTFSSYAGVKQHARAVHTLAAIVAAQPTPTQTTQPSAKLHRCDNCQRTFASKRGHKRHVETMHTLAAVLAPTQTTQPSAKVHRCGVCLKTFSSKGERTRHARTMHMLTAVVAARPPPTQTTQPPAKVHRCGDCRKTFSSKGERKRHGRTVHKGAVGPPGTQATRPASKTQENLRSAPPREGAGAAQRCDARLETMQTKPIAAYSTHCAVCDSLVPSPHWIAHVSDAIHAKSRREADVTLKRRMSSLSRGRVQVDPLALDFGGAAARTQTLRVTNVGRSPVYFSPWIRGKPFVLKGGSEKRMLKPSASKWIEVKLVDAPVALRGRLPTRLDITFQLPDQEGRATVMILISA